MKVMLLISIERKDFSKYKRINFLNQHLENHTQIFYLLYSTNHL
jgi:hypothetical protein